MFEFFMIMVCETFNDIKMHLSATEYGPYLQNDNLTLHERDVQELLEKCHPLGMFDSMATLEVAENIRKLYRLVLVDTPLAPYFSEGITSKDLDDMNIEIMRNTLYKAYIEDFYKIFQKLGGATTEVMSDLLAFEADRRVVNITINSISIELTCDDRRKLYSNFGLLSVLRWKNILPTYQFSPKYLMERARCLTRHFTRRK